MGFSRGSPPKEVNTFWLLRGKVFAMERTPHETALCLIKQHKNRGRYELYIHEPMLREFVKSHEFEVISEGRCAKAS